MNSISQAMLEGNLWNMTDQERKLYYYKQSHRPENKKVYDKPHDTGEYGTRRRSRPWDNCWFSNKPHIISLTIEEAISKHPDYMLWCYKNLSIKWSVHTVRLFDKLQPKTKVMTASAFMSLV